VHFQRIDQLRGFAAVAVVLCHAKGSAEAVVADPSQQSVFWLAELMGWGYLGVPLFLVISGLCIHLPAASAQAAGRSAPPRWERFFQRRFWRLYPAYLAALVVAAGLLLATRGGLPASWHGVLAEALLVHTLHPATFVGLNPPDWTLALEAQLYLAYPIVWLLFARLGGWRGLAVVMTATMLFRASLNFDWVPAALGAVAWEIFLARWLEWALGALLALWAVGLVTMPRAARSPVIAAMTLAVAVLAEWQMWRPGMYTVKEPLYGIAFALVVLVTLDRERTHQTMTTALGRWLGGVGVYSYSLYLLHRPIQLALEPTIGHVAALRFLGIQPLTTSLLLMTALTPMLLAAARVFHRYCEAPAVAVAQRIGRVATADGGGAGDDARADRSGAAA
jgi:peptidoglycan/LPS O-acetylase OafA/YrhL